VPAELDISVHLLGAVATPSYKNMFTW